MFHITTSAQFRAICPQFKGSAIYAEVKNSPTSPDLWHEITDCVSTLRASYTTESIKSRSGIASTRTAYRAAGKDPSRYRPACEQLARRVLQGKDLYSVDTIVDLTNLVSLSSGYAVGAIDADKIAGTEIALSIGQEGEPYEGIGRGSINIACLPAYYDAVGPFATPTSDSTRTMLSPSTCHLLVLINGYDGNETTLGQATDLCQRLLCRYAEAQGCHVIGY